MREVIRAYQSVVSAEIVRYDGRVAKLMGDGVLAYFGWPRAHEDDAERAIRSGLSTAQAVSSLRAPGGDVLAARIGIATGLVVVGDLIGQGSAREEAVIGDTPNLAARLQSLAEPNSVVIAEGTHRLVSGLFEAVDLGAREVKGFAAPVHAWRIDGEAAGIESRFQAFYRVPTPLAGRAKELDLLMQRWQRARTGEGQVVLLSGEPGIGKSRLTAELVELLSAERHSALRYFCSPYHSHSAFYPLIRQLERAAGLKRKDDANSKLDKLEALLSQASQEPAEAAPLFAALLSIDSAERYPPLNLLPHLQKSRTVSALIRQIEAVAARQPTLILIEDSHWMDPTSGEWLDMLVDRIQSLPVLLVVTFRPEFQQHWTQFPHVTLLVLSRLGREDGVSIISRVAGGKTLPPEVSNQILGRTEGVPLFVEELTKTVLESGLLTDAGDRYSLPGPLPAFAIPSTLHDSLMARLDRLTSVKEIAQIGACIGRVFSHRLLAAVTGSDETRLADDLQRLEESELIFQSGVPPEANYAFKHALVQDAAYQSLLKSRRQQIHAIIASRLEAQFPEIAESEPETLGHHFTAAGLADQAVAYWLKAGQQAQKRSANVEALAHFDKGLEVAGSLPISDSRLRHELRLQSAIGVTSMATKGWGAPEVLHAFSAARKLCEELGDKNELFVAVRGEAAYRTISGSLHAADELGDQCLQIAQASRDTDLVLEAHHQAWATKFFMGDYLAAEMHAEQAMAIYKPDRDHRLTYIYTGHDPGVCARNYSAQALCLRGFPDQALERIRDGLALADRHSHALTTITAQSTLGLVHLMRREPDAAMEWIEQHLDMANRFAVSLMAAQAQFHRGWAFAQKGQARGLAEMRKGIDGIAATGADMGMQYLLCVLALACGEHGMAEEGLALVDKALDVIAKTRTRHQVPEVMRTKGELLLQLNPRGDDAETWFRRSLSLASSEGVRSSELRSATSLARLFMIRTHEEKAREVLAPVVAWFSEGLDTPDLVDARVLLDAIT